MSKKSKKVRQRRRREAGAAARLGEVKRKVKASNEVSKPRAPVEVFKPNAFREAQIKALVGDTGGDPNDPLDIAYARGWLSFAEREALDLCRKRYLDFARYIGGVSFQTSAGGAIFDDKDDGEGIQERYNEVRNIIKDCTLRERNMIGLICYSMGDILTETRVKFLKSPAKKLCVFFGVDTCDPFKYSAFSRREKCA